MDDLPAVTFLVLAKEHTDSLPGCLETITSQEYPDRLVETVVLQGGDCTETAAAARHFGATVLPCDDDDAISRINLGISRTRGDIIFVIRDDSGLSRSDWIRLMVRPFMDRPEVAGVFTQAAEISADSAFAQYLCRINGDPFTWFVHGDTANPRYCRGMYGVAAGGEGYAIYNFPAKRPPMISADQGTGVRRSALYGLDTEKGPDAPLIRLIESGLSVAMVPKAGVHHHAANSLWLFWKEYRARLRRSPHGWPVCPEQHPSHRSLWRRARKHLFGIYGFTVVMPLFDGIWLSVFERSFCMLWHGPATVVLSWLVLVERLRRLVGMKSEC